MKKVPIVALALILLTGCKNWHSPTAATPADSSSISSSVLADWMPCVIVHPAGARGSAEFNYQIDAIQKLTRAGRLSWVRMGERPAGDYTHEIKKLGLHIFGIIELKDLEADSNWYMAFDRIYSLHPEVEIWEIGGEITNPAINNPTMNPDEYMIKLRALYEYTQSRYQVRLASAPTLGSVGGDGVPGGPQEFQRFIELGLLDMDIMPTVNIYSENALQEYAAVFDRYAGKLATKRIWVTETGGVEQISWVENFYPRIKRTVRPEMICWYALWTGDQGSDYEFGLIKNLTRPPEVQTPLFQALTGGVR